MSRLKTGIIPKQDRHIHHFRFSGGGKPNFAGQRYEEIVLVISSKNLLKRFAKRNFINFILNHQNHHQLLLGCVPLLFYIITIPNSPTNIHKKRKTHTPLFFSSERSVWWVSFPSNC